MPTIQIPLTHGQSEAIDAKLLPQGLLSNAKNIRFRKDGRVATRNGFATISGAPTSVIASAAFAKKHAVAIKSRVAAATPAQVYTRLDSGSYAATTQSATDLGGVRRFQVARNMINFGATSCDTAYHSGTNTLIYCYVDEHVVSSSETLVILVLDAATNTVLGTTTFTSNRPSNAKLVVVGQYVFCCWAELSTNNVKASRWNTASGFTFAAATTLQAAAAGRALYFDIAPEDSTHFLLVLEDTLATSFKWYRVDTTPTATNLASQAIAASVVPTICKVGGATNIAVAWTEAQNLYYGTWTSAGAVSVAKTGIDTSGLVFNYPAIGPHPTSSAAVVWERQFAGNPAVGTYLLGGTATYQGLGLEPRCKPFTIGTATYVWVMSYAANGAAIQAPSYALMSVDSTGSDKACDAIAAQLNAPTLTYTHDIRRSAVTIAASAVTLPGYCYCALPISLSTGYGVDAIRFEFGSYIDTMLPAHIGGRLLFSGARVHEYDGTSFTPAGLAFGPESVLIVAHGAGTGSLGAGSYQYVVVWEWYDSAGNRHLSPPSLPISQTTVATDSTTLSIFQPSFTPKAISVKIYRTLVNGDIFYLLNTAKTLKATPGSTTLITYDDGASDSSISSNEVLYTQGERGGLSGLLANDEPPPCKFIWAGNDRVILGGLENASEYAFSKLLFPDEPITFSIELMYRGRIDGEITGVWSLDGVWYLASRDAIYAVTGDGPDDNGQGGSFSSPVKLPADVGCISQRSVVEIPQGILFQGRSDRIYLLPRGGGAPQWVGQAVRDTLLTFPFIASATLVQDDNTVRFNCLPANADALKIIVFDTRTNEWSVDTPADTDPVIAGQHTAHVYDGKLVLDGIYTETATYDDFGVHATMAITMGDVRPFGPLGRGRARSITLLGEFRSDCTVTVAISYDSGITYSSDDSFAWLLGTGGQAQTAGDSVSLRFLIPKVRGSTFRPRITVDSGTNGEGFRLNAVAFEVFPEEGTQRLAAAYQG